MILAASTVDQLLLGLTETLAHLIRWADGHRDNEVGARAVATLAKVEGMQAALRRQMGSHQ